MKLTRAQVSLLARIAARDEALIHARKNPSDDLSTLLFSIPMSMWGWTYANRTYTRTLTDKGWKALEEWKDETGE